MSTFARRCQAEAARFLQNVGAETFPELHVLGNCYISGAPCVSLAVLWASDPGGPIHVDGRLVAIYEKGGRTLAPSRGTDAQFCMGNTRCQ